VIFGVIISICPKYAAVEPRPYYRRVGFNKTPVFSDIGFFRIAETDWSWTPLVADFDNDGKKDILFTNGFPKDITDHDL